MDGRLTAADAIVFDIGQVLLFFDAEKACSPLPEYCRRELYDVMFEGPDRLWRQFDLGAESNETISRRIAEKAGCPEEWHDVLNLLNTFHETLEPTPMTRLLPELRARGKRLYVLSNFPEPSLTLACRKFSFLGEMDGIVGSAREKMVKPDPAIFRLIRDRYSLVPENTLFIDDVEENTLSAAKEGFRVWHYSGEDRIF